MHQFVKAPENRHKHFLARNLVSIIYQFLPITTNSNFSISPAITADSSVNNRAPHPATEHSSNNNPGRVPDPDFENERDANGASAEDKTAVTSTGKNRASAGHPGRKRRIQETDDNDDKPKLTLRQGRLDETPGDMLLTYTITWVCRFDGKKIAEDTIKNVKDSLETFWIESLHFQREHHLQQCKASKNRKFLTGHATVMSPGKIFGLPFAVDSDSTTSGAQWKAADGYLIHIGNLHAEKDLIVKIEWDFLASSNMARYVEKESEKFEYWKLFQHDVVLRQYCLWLQYHCSSQRWRQEIRKAADVCETRFLPLEYAIKKPLEWWLERGVKEGIARMFCDDVKIWRNWRIAGDGRIKKVEAINSPDRQSQMYHVTIVYPPAEMPLILPNSRFPGLGGNGHMVEDIHNNLGRESLLALQIQEVIDEQPVVRHMEEAFSHHLSNTRR